MQNCNLTKSLQFLHLDTYLTGVKCDCNRFDVVTQGSATFFAQRTGLSRKTFRGPALKININI